VIGRIAQNSYFEQFCLHGKPVSIFWRDEDTLVIDGDERKIILAEWDADSIAFAAEGEGLTALRVADPEKFTDALCARFAELRHAAADDRAERIERVAGEVARQKADELGRPLSREELAYVRKLARAHIVGRTD
jgi:hypothetical protein